MANTNPTDDWMTGLSYDPTKKPEGFDFQNYLKINTDLGAAGIDTEAEALRHYQNYGMAENRNIGALQSTQTSTPEPASGPAPAPTDNWMSGQWYNPNVMPENFDWQRYVAANQDLGQAGIDTQEEAQRHYFNYGQKEGRNIGALNPMQGGTLSPEDYRAALKAYREATGDDRVLTGVTADGQSDYGPVNDWINRNYIPQGKFVTDYSAAKPADNFELLNTMQTSNRPVEQLANIKQAWDQYKDKPSEMRRLMQEYGVTLGDLSQATGETYNQLNTWVKGGDILGVIGFSVNQPGAYDKYKAQTTAKYDPDSPYVVGPSTPESRLTDFQASQQKAANTFDPLAYEKYKQFITAGMPPEEAFKQSGLKSQYYAPEGAAQGTQQGTQTAAGQTTEKATTEPPKHTYDEAYGLYGDLLRSGEISAEKIKDLYGYYSPEFTNSIIKIKGEIDQQKKAGTADYWGAGNLASPDAAAWDAAFRLAEKGVGSLYDLKQQDGQTVNTKTGKPLEGFGNAYNHDLDFHISYTKDGKPILTASNQKSEWVDKYRAPVTAAALLALGYYGPEMFAGAGAAGAGAGTGAAVTAGEAAAVGSSVGTGVAAGTSLATKVGMTLGLEGTAATMAGNALIQGTVSELTGGDFVKGAVTGAITGGAFGQDVGAFVTENLGLTVGSAVQTAIGNTIIETIANGGDLESAVKKSVGNYLGTEIANSKIVTDLVGSGAMGDAVKGALRGSITNAAQGKDALEGAIVGGTSAFINRVTTDALKDNKAFTPVEKRDITNGITTFVTAKASGATDEQAFMATIAATGSRSAARDAVKIVNRAPVAEMEATSQGTNIQSSISPEELDERVGLQLASADTGTVSDAGSDVFRVEMTSPILANHPKADQVKVPFGYQLMTAAEHIGDTLPEGSYYDITQNAWLRPSGEVQQLSDAILNDDEAFLRQIGIGSTTSLGESPSNQEILDQIGYIDPNDQTGPGTGSGAGSNEPDGGVVEVTSPRENEPDGGVVEVTTPRENEPDGGVVEVTTPRETEPDGGVVEVTSPKLEPEKEPPKTTAPTTPTTPAAPTAPVITQLRQQLGLPSATLASGTSGPPRSPFDSPFLRSTETQKAIDPLARVKQAQAELEREVMMNNIDPRLMSVLQQRTSPEQQGLDFQRDIGALSKILSGQSGEKSYYSYGAEDSVDSILGGGARTYKDGGFVEPLKAEGGMVLPLLAKSGGALGHYEGREDFKDGKHVAGDGDGQSDDIPAWLADGEFVFPADVVSALGNGSTKAGTDKLYAMMHGIRDRARSKGPKDLPPPALKSPLDYLKSSKRSHK